MGLRLAAPALAILLALMALAACGGSEPDGSAQETKPQIFVTTSILGDVVSSMVGGEAQVEVLIPAGADPHDFELSARAVAELRDGTVLIANGLGLEAGLRTSIAAARDDGLAVVEVAPLVDPIAVGRSVQPQERHGAALDNEHSGHDHGDGLDPHFWHDPRRMREAVGFITEALIEAEPSLDTPALHERIQQLDVDLAAVDGEVEEILSVVPAERRYLVTNHANFSYLAARYGFSVIGTVIAGGDTLAAPSAGELAALASEIKAHRLPAIFTDNTVPAVLVQTVADEVGYEVEVVTLYSDSLGPEGSGADTYLGLLLTNAKLIAEALA